MTLSILEKSDFDRKDQEVIRRVGHLCRAYEDFDPGFSGIAMVGDFNLDITVPKDAMYLADIISGSACKIMNLSSDHTHQNGATLDQVSMPP